MTETAAEPEYRILSVGNVLVDAGQTEIADERRTGSPTVTLILSAAKSVLVDPGCGLSLSPRDEAKKLLAAVAQYIDPAHLTTIFITHPHDDHMNLALFFKVKAFTGLGEVIPGVVACDTSGHFPEHRSLFFRQGNDRVVAAGDAVINEEYFNAADPRHRVYGPNEYFDMEIEQSLETIELIRKTCDIVIPGHGRPFRVRAASGC
jgi:glyoxylase-like metal-dependent hydrolase (beta-lactamase superfamily II)